MCPEPTLIARLGAAFAVFALCAVNARASDAGGFDLAQVAPGVYVHAGVHAGLDDSRRADSANIGFVVGEDCVAVIDTGGSMRTGSALRAALRAVTDNPVCYVINTHVHFDHVLGNAAFSPDRPAFAGHARLAEAMEANRAFFAENFAAELGGAGAAAVIVPGLLVEDSLRIDLGGRPLLLEAWPAAHTSQDLTVFDLRSGTLWLGDLVFLERIPALDGSLRGWIAALEQLGAREVARVIPGHGPVVAEWPAAAAATRRYLDTLLGQTRAAIAEGLSLGEALDRVGRGERDQWLLFDANHGRNVTRAYKELEWE